MALPKRVKIGGSYYKGYQLVVSYIPGDYVLNMTLASEACAINSITVVPDTYGTGDYFKLEHLDPNGEVVATLAETIYNVGANAAWSFDFPALELMESGHTFRLTYTNVAGLAVNVYTNVERIK